MGKTSGDSGARVPRMASSSALGICEICGMVQGLGLGLKQNAAYTFAPKGAAENIWGPHMIIMYVRFWGGVC